MRRLLPLLGILALAACAGDVDPEEADLEIEGTFADSTLAPGATLQPDEGLAPDALLQPEDALAPAGSLREPVPTPGP